MQKGGREFFVRSMTAAVYGALLVGIFFLLPPFCFSLLLLLIFVCIGCFEWPVLFAHQRCIGVLLFPLYPLLPFILLVMLNHQPVYRHLVCMLFVLVSCFDTGAYIVGSLCGNHLIAPLVTARKTWEGFAGGLGAALAAMGFFVWWHPMFISSLGAVVFTGVVCVVSLAGDLFESWLKRRAKVKDSGTLLPGHGGFLDRLDGVLFVVVLVYVLRDWLV